MLIISFHPYTGVSKKRQYFPYSFCVSNFSISLVALCMYICRHIDMDIDIDVDIAIDIDIDVDTHLAIVKPEGTVQHASGGRYAGRPNHSEEDSKGNFVGQAAAAPRAEEPCLWEWRTCIEGG